MTKRNSKSGILNFIKGTKLAPDRLRSGKQRHNLVSGYRLAVSGEHRELRSDYRILRFSALIVPVCLTLSGLVGVALAFAQGGPDPTQIGGQKSHSYASERSDAHPFRPGERLVFRVIYFAMPAGTATLEVKGTSEVQGIPVYHFRAEAKSSAVFSLFYRVRDRLESFVDIANLLPLRFEKHLREGPRYKNDDVTIFHHSLNIAETEGRETEIPENTQDYLSAFYYLRVQPLEVGKSVFVDVNVGKKNYRIEVRVLRKEIVKKWGKRVETIVVQPVIKDVSLGGILKEKGDVFIWLTDDEKKIPVFIEAKVVIGQLSFVLVEYEEGETSGEKEAS